MIRTLTKDDDTPLSAYDMRDIANHMLELAYAYEAAGLCADAANVKDLVAWYEKQASRLEATMVQGR